MTVVFDREPYGLRLLRRAATKGYAVTVYPDEAADVVTEIERLRAQVAELQALGVSLHKAADKGAKYERAAVVAWLRSRGMADYAQSNLDYAATMIERGGHRREEGG
jgi:hypothetical protein